MSSEALREETTDIHNLDKKDAPLSRSFIYARKVFALYGYRRASYFLLQALLHPKAFAKWFDFIETALPKGTSDLFKIRLAMKPATRFVSRPFGVAERVAALTSYYAMLTGRFPPAALSTFMSGYQLAEITGKSGKKYIIKAVQIIVKEGILSIRFFDPEAHATAPLAILTGLISLDHNGHPVFTVGMLRGPGIGVKDAKQVVVDATRDLNGLRPKQAVVHAAAAVAQWFQAEEILAPTSKNEIPIKNWLKGSKIKADHDSFWEEFSNEAAPDGNYHLPLPLPRRNVTEVQNKRRKDWILRYERIDLMSAEIKRMLDGLSRGYS